MVHKTNQLKKDYLYDVKNDLDVLRSIQNEWKILKNKNFIDPKTDSFNKNY